MRLKRNSKKFRESASSLSTVKYSSAVFRRGHTRIFDEERPDCPLEVMTSNLIEKIRNIVIYNRRVKVLQIGETTGTSTE